MMIFLALLQSQVVIPKSDNNGTAIEGAPHVRATVLTKRVRAESTVLTATCSVLVLQ